MQLVIASWPMPVSSVDFQTMALVYKRGGYGGGAGRSPPGTAPWVLTTVWDAGDQRHVSSCFIAIRRNRLERCRGRRERAGCR